MDTVACSGPSQCRLRSGILRFRSVKIQSMTRKPKQYGQCNHCFDWLFVWWEEAGSGLSRKFDVNNVFRTELFSFPFILFSSISHIYRERTSMWTRSNLIAVCWYPVKFQLTRHKHWYNSYWCGSGCWFELATQSFLPGKAIAFKLGREFIVLVAAWSSFPPRPVPENRCVMCHVLNRWTCHMPLKLVIQLSLTLWMNSSSLLHQSLNRQKMC